MASLDPDTIHRAAVAFWHQSRNNGVPFTWGQAVGLVQLRLLVALGEYADDVGAAAPVSATETDAAP